MFKTARAALTSRAFIGQATVSFIINFLINWGFAYGSYGQWGGEKNTAAWPVIYGVQWNAKQGSCLLLDVPLTAFLLSFFCVLLATNGARKDVLERKCDTLDPAVTSAGLWLYTPVRFRGLLLRSAASGVYFTSLIGFPSFLLFWAAAGGGGIPGFAYTLAKGFWAAALSLPVYVVVFMAAIDARNFPELELEALRARTGGGEIDSSPIPLVGNVALV